MGSDYRPCRAMLSRTFLLISLGAALSLFVPTVATVGQSADSGAGAPSSLTQDKGGGPQQLLNSGSEAPPGTFLQGNVTVLGPGTHFRCTLDNTLDSSYTREGEQFLATVTEPVVLDGRVAVPPGSKLTGRVVKVVSARNFNFGVNAKIDVKFIAVQTPDGRKFPINASIDVNELRAAGGANRNPGSRAAASAGHGAVRGLKYGAGIGGLYGVATSRSAFVGRNSAVSRGLRYGAMGALAGSVVGAGVGLVASGVKKGAEVKVPAGTNLPVQLDEPLTMDQAHEGEPAEAAQAEPDTSGQTAQQIYNDVPPDYPQMPQPVTSSPQASYAAPAQPYPAPAGAGVPPAYPPPGYPAPQPATGYPAPGGAAVPPAYPPPGYPAPQPATGYPVPGGAAVPPAYPPPGYPAPQQATGYPAPGGAGVPPAYPAGYPVPQQPAPYPPAGYPAPQQPASH